MRAAIYIRLSKVTATTVSPETQLAACQRLIELQGWEEVARFEDIDVSGGTSERPGLNMLRASFADLDRVVFYKVDRLSRSVIDFHEIMAEAEKHGAALVSATEPLDLANPMGRAFAGIIAIFAELERDQISARVLAGQETLLQNGRFRGGPAPFGWRSVPHPEGAGTWLALDPEPSQRLISAIDALLQPQGSLKDAVAVIYGTERPPGAFTTVRQWMASRRLVGQAERRTRGPGVPAIVRGPDGFPVPSNEPLISEETYRKIQARLEERTVKRSRQPRSRLLSGVALCWECRRPLYVSGTADQPAYRCVRADCRRHMTVSAGPLETYVQEWFAHVIAPLPEYEIRYIGGDPDREAREEYQARLDQLAVEFANGSVSATAYSRATNIIDELIDSLAPKQGTERELVPTGSTFGETWAVSSLAERGQLLRENMHLRVRSGKRGVRGFRSDQAEIGFGVVDVDPAVWPDNMEELMGGDRG